MKIAAIGNWKKFSERGDHKEIGLIRQKIMEMPEMRGIMLVQTKYNLKTSGYRWKNLRKLTFPQFGWEKM